MENFPVTVLPRPADTEGLSGQLTTKSFCALQNFVVLKKFALNI